MRGYVFDIKRFALHDGPGIRTTVFFVGCPLSCMWCHNPESLRELPSENIFNHSSCEIENKFIVKQYSVDELTDQIKKDIVFYEESGGGVTFSGGEPFNQTDFLLASSSACKSYDISVVIDTSGYTSYSSIERVINFTDQFNYDLKIVDDKFHTSYTGVSNETILSNLKQLSSDCDKVQIRIPLIPDITDTKKNLNDSINFITGLKQIKGIDLLPFNILAQSKYKRLNKELKLANLSVQSDERLIEIMELFRSANLNVSLRG